MVAASECPGLKILPNTDADYTALGLRGLHICHGQTRGTRSDFLRGLPFPARGNQLRSLTVLPLSIEPAHGGGGVRPDVEICGANSASYWQRDNTVAHSRRCTASMPITLQSLAPYPAAMS